MARELGEAPRRGGLSRGPRGGLDDRPVPLARRSQSHGQLTEGGLVRKRCARACVSGIGLEKVRGDHGARNRRLRLSASNFVCVRYTSERFQQ